VQIPHTSPQTGVGVNEGERLPSIKWGEGFYPPLHAATMQPISRRYDTVCPLLAPLQLRVAGQVEARGAQVAWPLEDGTEEVSE